VNPRNDAANCGACGMLCGDGQRCQAGACRAMGGGGDDEGPESSGLDVVELEKLVMRFGVELDDVLERLDLEREELAGVELSVADLERVGISLEELMSAGITLADLERAGIEVG
jgi:hypothetical protein